MEDGEGRIGKAALAPAGWAGRLTGRGQPEGGPRPVQTQEQAPAEVQARKRGEGGRECPLNAFGGGRRIKGAEGQFLPQESPIAQATPKLTTSPNTT